MYNLLKGLPNVNQSINQSINRSINQSINSIDLDARNGGREEGRKGGREGRGWGVEVVSNNESPNTTRRRSLLVFLLVYRSNKQTNKQTDSLLKTSVTIIHCKALFIWRKVTTGPPPPRANFTTRVHGKNVSRVMMSCPSPRTEISARACSEWRDLARQGELTRLKPFT